MNGNDDEDHQNRHNEQSFVGLKSPDHLKKVCNMFRNNDFKNQPHKYMQNLKNNINYENPEIYKGPVKTDIISKSHGNGYLHLKVFKILNPKKGGTSGDSDDERVGNSNNVNKNIKALIEDATRKTVEQNSADLFKKIQLMKQALVQLKKGIRHPSTKQKPSNIVTPGAYESAEIKRYETEIKNLAERYRDLKQKEEEVKL